MTEKEKKERDNKDSLIGLAQGEIVQRHGEASSQILQAYKGIRVDHNGHLEDFYGRNLKQISEYNLGDNPDVSRKRKCTGRLRQPDEVFKIPYHRKWSDKI